MSAVVTADPATGERLAGCRAFSDAEVDAAPDRAEGAQAGCAAAVGTREFVDVRTWWVLDEPAVAAPRSE